MRFKVDENLHEDLVVALRKEGHVAHTVYEEQLRGSPDAAIAEVCQREGRVLVTLDLDFGNIREYPPEDYPGLMVLRVVDQSRPHVLQVFSQIFELLPRQPLSGHLWVISESGVRIRPGISSEGTS
jgi:predicted nuclease of predicted toxin-antitoxin system